MDLSTLTAPAFTSLDATTQAIGAACYATIGVAAWIRARRDIRTRVFLAFALSNLVVLGIPTIWWLRGTNGATKLPVPATAAMMAALGVGALLLFHFTQVFPRRRPWIRTSGAQMAIAYCLTPIAIGGLVRFAPASPDALAAPYVLALLVFGFPLMVLLGFVVPVTAIVSLVRSRRDVHQAGLAYLKRPIELLLISQVAGGALAILFAPLVAVLAPRSLAQSVLTLSIWALGLLTPIAFATAVWKHDVLAVNPD